MQLWTIGHSTDTIDDFIGKLQAHAITLVADVRRFPASRRHPHFAQQALRDSLAIAEIGYEHFPELGGRRPARKDSPNVAWRVDAFRGYADYMDTAPFQDGIDRLLGIAASHRVVIMCAERVWWSCHRSLISDLLKSRGHHVLHILASERADEHPYSAAARIVDGALSYRALF